MPVAGLWVIGRCRIAYRNTLFERGNVPNLSDERRAQRSAFGARVRNLRGTLGVSQEELAHLAKLDRTYVGSVERGERNVSLDNICRLRLRLVSRRESSSKSFPALSDAEVDTSRPQASGNAECQR